MKEPNKKEHKDHKNVFEDTPYVDLKTMQLDRDVGKILSEEICRKIEGVVIGKPSDDDLSIAVKDPSQIYIYDTVAYATDNKYKCTLFKADPKLVDLAVEFIFTVPAQAQGAPWTEWLEGKKFEGEELDVVSTDAAKHSGLDIDITGSIIEKGNKLIMEAISLGASDIHLEMFEKQLTIRFRIDGVLHVMDVITDMDQAAALVSRLKIMANMDISENRITQGGRISVQVKNEEFDLRVSIVPVPAGESLVLRLLNKGAFNLKLKTLGFNEPQFESYRKMVSFPYGIILVSGPTGSGKSTTLYASLKDINRPDRKLLTVEDPIEYDMEGIVQVQVNLAPKDEDKKVTFSKALREFLRQDPDVILVGEIRDEETAEISIQAAQTGHLVLSTIHTNDAVGVINRLKDMKVKPYLISSTLIGAVAQRLVRRLCPKCKKAVDVPDDMKPIMRKIPTIDKAQFFEPEGCPHCRRTGYRGRVGLFEILLLHEEIRDMIERSATAHEIFQSARKHGMRVLLEDGVEKAATGLTSADEVRRVCMMTIGDE